MQNVSGETFNAVSVRKSLSKLSDFQSVTASPYRVLHQAQGDKQEINPIRLKSSSKTNGSTQQNRTMHLYRGKWVYFLFIALKRLTAF